MSGEIASFRARTVRLRDFRSYGSLEVNLGPGFHLVAGPNGQGKTNFLEAIHLLSTTRLLRPGRDSDAIRFGNSGFRVEAVVESGAEIAIALEAGGRKRGFLNGSALPRAADLIGRLPCVAVSALDLDLVRGEPAVRRLFLDVELSQAYPAYLVHLSHYRRALDQRNALLRQAQSGRLDAGLMETWEEPLAEHGAQIRSMRRAHVAQMQEEADRVQPAVAPGETLELGYETKDDAGSAEDLKAKLARRETDLARATTTVGPHRDDLRISACGHDLRTFGSQGQQRTGAISLKLATLLLGRRLLGATPVLLLDDILSDLDEGRRSRLVEWVCGHAGQAILTCTEVEAAGAEILRRAKIFDVRNGTLQER